MFVPSMHLNVHTYIYMPIDMPMLTHNAHLCVYLYKCASILWLMPRAAQDVHGRPWDVLGQPWSPRVPKDVLNMPEDVLWTRVLLRFDVEPNLMLWVHRSLARSCETAGQLFPNIKTMLGSRFR